MNQKVRHLYEFGPYVLDPDERVLRKDGRLITTLEPKEFDVLLYLVVSKGRLVRKSELTDHFWPGTGESGYANLQS